MLKLRLSWKGTILYHRTKDIYYVKEYLGHKNFQSAQVYIHIERALFRTMKPSEYNVKIANKKEEIVSLLEGRKALPISEKGSSRIMDSTKIYGIISHPLYFMNSKSSIFIFPFFISFNILGVSSSIAFIVFSTVWHTSL